MSPRTVTAATFARGRGPPASRVNCWVLPRGGQLYNRNHSCVTVEIAVCLKSGQSSLSRKQREMNPAAEEGSMLQTEPPVNPSVAKICNANCPCLLLASSKHNIIVNKRGSLPRCNSQHPHPTLERLSRIMHTRQHAETTPWLAGPFFRPVFSTYCSARPHRYSSLQAAPSSVTPKGSAAGGPPVAPRCRRRSAAAGSLPSTTSAVGR